MNQGFWKVPEQRKRTGMIPSTSTRVSETEVQSKSTEVYGSVECARKRLELFRAKVELSKQDKLSMSSSLIFRMQKHT